MQEGLTIQANGRWQQIKLLRAEWAHPRTIPGLYSRVLYITNLMPVSLQLCLQSVKMNPFLLSLAKWLLCKIMYATICKDFFSEYF